ncbi:MAG: pentapeptide repeat-containing protein [Pseudanabaena sp. Salubria-1]|nr:pentapeptide repeat-containing protein [Pseudanabaena sp. Salubria-1]
MLGAFLAIVVGAFVGEFLFVIVLSSLFEVANILKVLSINTLKHLSLYVESDSEKLARIVATAERIYTEKDLWLTPLKIIGATISTFISIRLHLGSAFFGGSTLFAGKNAVARAIQELGDGDKALGIVYLGIAFCLLYPAYTFFIEAVEKILNMTATSFEGSELTNAKFVGAILKNCDFTDAKLYQIDWTHAHFNRCKFSSYLSNQLVRELCVTRIGTNQDFSYIDLSDLNLIGVDLRGANLNASNLNRTNLMQADLQNTNLHKTQAIKTDFTNANLSGACIENWAITTETIFTDVVCSHIFLDTTKNERKPSSGYFEKDDFEKLVTQSTKSLDFFFRNGIDPQAFDFALNNLIDNYHEMGISLKSVEDFGDGDRIVRFNTVSDAPKAEMHAQFTQDYEEIHQQLEASRNKIWELQQKLDRIDLENLKVRYELEKQLAVAIAKLEERPTSKDLQNLLYHQVSELGKQKLIYANNSTINMIDKSIQSGGDVFFTGRDNVGVSGKDLQGVAGRDISGTVTNTIQQLRETNQPEAPQLSDLLEQLQKAVESSDELDKPEKEKALDYLNKIVEMSVKEPAQKKGMLPILLDAFTGVISKAANLIDPVKKIAAAILSIWQA